MNNIKIESSINLTLNNKLKKMRKNAMCMRNETLLSTLEINCCFSQQKKKSLCIQFVHQCKQTFLKNMVKSQLLIFFLSPFHWKPEIPPSLVKWWKWRSVKEKMLPWRKQTTDRRNTFMFRKAFKIPSCTFLK